MVNQHLNFNNTEITMKSVQKFTVILMLIFGISITAQAQSMPETGSIGIRANITGQTSIEVPYMLNESLSLAPYLGFSLVGDTDDNTPDGNKTISVGISPRYYLSEVASIQTYGTGNLGINIFSSNVPNANSVTNFVIGAGYGGEYFFSENFSISADANLNLNAGDSRTRLNTMARISASIYF